MTLCSSHVKHDIGIVCISDQTCSLTGTELPYTLIQSYTAEVGSLHTLRLESLKLVFQPLHKFLVNKSDRTSTLCMTRVMFPTIVYRQIISLIIHCITIPVCQKFTYTKLTVPLNSFENSRKSCHVFRSLG